jgi:glycosyltransferase involved in cell wall biosynthesis
MTDANGFKKILILCDWLPPDFGAVGQYAVGFAKDLAEQGHQVSLTGFSSLASSQKKESSGVGTVLTRRIYRSQYDRGNFIKRGLWTLGANIALLFAARREFFAADEIRFTGSPPYLIHFVMPLAVLFRKKTRYRITDFHPECLMATYDKVPLWMKLLHRVTRFWRRRVSVIEVLGEDQKRHILAAGISDVRVELLRDPSPVRFDANHVATEVPESLRNRKIILYSGNWGVAHEHLTFVEGFDKFCRKNPDVASLWLNATGGRADLVEAALKERSLPFVRTRPVPLEQLPAVLLAADVHLITLLDNFVGYVLPSKVYACIASNKPILFIGSRHSDVHLLSEQARISSGYQQVRVGDADQVCVALETLLNIAEPG